MAGDWIKWSKGLASRREVIVIASRLQRDRHEIAGRLMVLWEWCDENMTDDDIDPDTLNVSLQLGDKPFAFVDAQLGLPGMADAMAAPDVRWIEARNGGRITFPNLARHNGTSAKTRASESRKKQNQRKSEKSRPGKCPDDNGTKSGPEREKRREENTPSECVTRERPPPNGPSHLVKDRSELLSRWNECPEGVRGVARIRGMTLPPAVVPLADDALSDPIRRQACFDAIEAIKSGAIEWDRQPISLKTFLGGDEIDKILGGGHARRTSSGRGSAAKVRSAASNGDQSTASADTAATVAELAAWGEQQSNLAGGNEIASLLSRVGTQPSNE